MKILFVCLISLAFINFAFSANNEPKTVKIEITDQGTIPKEIHVNKGQKLILKVTRKTEKTCMTELKNMDGSKTIELPLGEEVSFEFGKANKKGKVDILCGMDMAAGVVIVK